MSDAPRQVPSSAAAGWRLDRPAAHTAGTPHAFPCSGAQTHTVCSGTYMYMSDVPVVVHGPTCECCVTIVLKFCVHLHLYPFPSPPFPLSLPPSLLSLLSLPPPPSLLPSFLPSLLLPLPLPLLPSLPPSLSQGRDMTQAPQPAVYDAAAAAAATQQYSGYQGEL